MECNTGKIVNLSSLYARFQRLPDRRKAKGKRYALATILVRMFLAKMCGEDKPSGIAEWVALRGEWIAQVLGVNSYNCFTRPATCGIGSPSTPPFNNIIPRMAEFIAGTALIAGGLLITALGGLIAGIGLAEVAGLSSIAPPLVIPTTLHARPAIVIGGIVGMSGVAITVVGGYLIYDSMMPSSPVAT